MKLSVLALFVGALAVKKELFRTCEQNPFCERNRHYARQQKLDAFDSPYSLTDITLENTLKATLSKKIPEGTVDLDFRIEFLEGIVHLEIDEPVSRREQVLGKSSGAVERFSPAPFMLDYSNYPGIDKFAHTKDQNTITLTKNDLKVVIQTSPFKLTLLRDESPEIILNGDSLLNFEHLRSKEANERNTWEVDSGAWQDRFGSHTDSKARGPESIAMDINFQGYQHVYGIPEHADVMNLRNTLDGEPYRLFNVDIFEYETNSTMPMYGSIPFMVAQKKNSVAGVFWLNAADSYIDIDRSATDTKTHWISENGKLDLYLFARKSTGEVLQDYSRLTGTSALPQLFATGYHQCRWNYMSADDVENVDANFDANEIPYDVIWLDVEYTVNKKYFTWAQSFDTREHMFAKLDKGGRKLVAIIDPHIKAEDGHKINDHLRAQSMAVLDAQAKSPFLGHCWPGESIWVDSFNPAVQPYWNSLFAMGGELEPTAQNLHIWNDMNEPSVFSGTETSAFKDLRHYGGWEHRDVHNLYGQMFVNNTFQAMAERYDGKQRPFILTRAFFAGSQRLAAMWTGDNMSKWEYLKQAIPQVLTQGLSGMPFAGADVGGFFGNPESELLTRWYQSGIFYPFFRAHAHIDARRREPYLMEEPYASVVRDAINLRYKLLPTLYTFFYESSKSLAPIIRPLFYEVPDNEAVYAIDDTFFLGDSILVKPVTDEGVKSINVYIPEDEYYYNFWTMERYQGPKDISVTVELDTIPMFTRGGKIMAMRTRARRSAELTVNDPYTLVVAVAKDGKASGKLYVDDGISYDYEHDDYVLAEFFYQEGKLSSKVHNKGTSGFKDLVVERVVVIGDKPPSSASYSGKNFDIVPIAGGYVIRNPRVAIGSEWEIVLE